jgi:hypothetical protein
MVYQKRDCIWECVRLVSTLDFNFSLTGNIRLPPPWSAFEKVVMALSTLSRTSTICASGYCDVSDAFMLVYEHSLQ